MSDRKPPCESLPGDPRRSRLSSGASVARTALATWALCAASSTLTACGAHTTGGAGQAYQPDPIARLSPAALFERALERIQHHDYVRAEQYLLAARSRGFPERNLMPTLMHALLAAGRLHAASSYAAPYLRRHPEDIGLRYLAATLHLALGDPERARTALARLGRDAPRHAPSHYLSGVIARDCFEDPGAAAAAFSHYLALAPEGAHAPEARSWLRDHPEERTP